MSMGDWIRCLGGMGIVLLVGLPVQFSESGRFKPISDEDMADENDSTTIGDFGSGCRNNLLGTLAFLSGGLWLLKNTYFETLTYKEESQTLQVVKYCTLFQNRA